MLFKVLACAGIVVLGAAQGASAQSLKGPRELPPPGYAGQQYVDSAGCVFLRAGINGRVTWVARVDRQRRQLCGYPATGGTRVAAAPEVEEPAPVAVADAPRPIPKTNRPVPGAEGGPIDTVASIATQPRLSPAVRQPVAAPAYVPPPVAAAAPAPAVASGTPGCPAAAPVGERHVLPDGRLALLCARDGVSLAAFVARSTQGPRNAPEPAVTQVATQPGVVALPNSASGFATDGRLNCPATAPVARSFPLQGGGSTVLCTSGAGGIETVVAAAGANRQPYVPVIPHGYTRAWQDDRLNPRRGVGTAQGQLAQDQVWTRDVPARLVSETVKVKKRVVVVSASNKPVAQVRTASGVTTSTSTAPTVAVSEGGARLYVQVGSFGVSANAAGARARLAGLGLPVAGGKGAINGKAVQVVYAGPFGSVAQAQAALNAARRAGFGDAFIR